MSWGNYFWVKFHGEEEISGRGQFSTGAIVRAALSWWAIIQGAIVFEEIIWGKFSSGVIVLEP